MIKSGIRIMVVDKEVNLAFLYSEELGEYGYEVVLHHERENLITAIEEKKPDALVLGVFERGYGKSDLELLKKIKTTFPNLPIVFNTSLSYLKEEAMAQGADYFNVKSSDLSSLVQIIGEIAEYIIGKKK